MDETGATSYAEAVMGVLRDHFPAATWSDPATAAIITTAVRNQASTPRDAFEVIVDDPRRADWRLKSRNGNKRQIRLACYRMVMRDADAELERAVNSALSALETGQ